MSRFLTNSAQLIQSSKKLQSSVLILSILILVVLTFRVARPWEISCVILLCTACIVNGMPFSRRYFLNNNSTFLGLLGFSFFIGLAISTFFISCILLICGWNLSIIFSYLFIINGLIIWKDRKSLRLYKVKPLWDSLMPYFLLIVILSIFLPLWGVGELTPKGYSFPSLFGHDLLYRIGYTAHVARGLSNESIFLAGQKIPYYYIFYIFPAIIYKVAGNSSHLLNIFCLLDVIIASFFVICLFEFFRFIHLNSHQKVLLGALGFISYSFKSIVCLFIELIKYITPFGKNLFLNFNYTITSHGWFRDFLVEPHSIWVISLFIACFIILGDLSVKDKLSERIIVCGFFLFVCFGIDSFQGLCSLSGMVYV